MRSFLLLFALAISGCGSLLRTPTEVLRASHRTVPDAELERPIPPEDLRADLAFLLATLENVHPNPYAFRDSAEVRRQSAALARSFNEPLTRLELWRRLAPFVASLGDGHTGLGYPAEEYERYRRAGGGLFPLAVEVSGDTLRADAAHGPIARGDRILAIDGKPAADLVHTVRATVSGESAHYRDDRARRGWDWRLWATTGATGPFTIETADTTVTLASAPRDTTRQTAEAAASPPALVHTRLEDGTGWLRVRTFSRSGSDFARELERVFAQIREDGTDRLAVDLRENGGGDSRLGDALLSYLTDEPYLTLRRMEWRRSREYGAHIKRHLSPWVRWAVPWSLMPQVGAYFRTPVGEDYVSEGTPRTPEERALRFKGEWVVLSGPQTFSSGTLFVLAVKDNGLAEIVGEETGGRRRASAKSTASTSRTRGSSCEARPSGSSAPAGTRRRAA